MEFVKNLQSFLQSYNKSLINQACSGPYWENIGPRSFLYGPRCARSVLSRPRADILPVRPSRLVNKIYIIICYSLSIYSLLLFMLHDCLTIKISIDRFDSSLSNYQMKNNYITDDYFITIYCK